MYNKSKLLIILFILTLGLAIGAFIQGGSFTENVVSSIKTVSDHFQALYRENEIVSIKYTSSGIDSAGLKVTYFYNGKNTGEPRIAAGMHTSDPGLNFHTRQEVISNLRVGEHEIYMSIPRQTPKRHQTDKFSVEMIGVHDIIIKELPYVVHWANDRYFSSRTRNTDRGRESNELDYAVSLIDTPFLSNVKQGKAMLDKLIVDFPNNPEIYAQLARANMKLYAQDNGFVTAEQILLTGLQIDPDHNHLLILLGYVYQLTGRHDKTDEIYLNLDKREITNPWFYTNWGDSYSKRNQTEEAKSQYFKAIGFKTSSESNYTEAQLQAFDHLIRLYIEEGNISKAEELHLNRLDKFSFLEELNEQYGRFLLLSKGEFKSALKFAGACMDRCSSIAAYTTALANYAIAHSLKNAGDDNFESYLRTARTISLDYNLLISLASSSIHTESSLPLITELGLDINGSSAKSQSPIIRAIQNGDVFSIKILKKYGADLNTVKYGPIGHPLTAALLSKQKEVVEVLIKNGADPHLKLAEGNSAIQLAAELGISDYIPNSSEGI